MRHRRRNWTTALVSWQDGTSSVWFTCRWLPNTEPCRSNGRVPSISRPETRYFVQPRSWMIGPMTDCAFGAMMLLALRQEFRKLRFQMIADITGGDCSISVLHLPRFRLRY